MDNFFKDINAINGFRKIDLESVTVIEYNCPIDADVLPVWTPHDVLIHCLSGKKTWHSCDSKVQLTKGESLFVAKGAQIVHQSFEEHVCFLMVFIKDSFKQQLKLEAAVGQQLSSDAYVTLEPIHGTPNLSLYFNSVMSLLAQPIPPKPELVTLKLKELVYLIWQDTRHQKIMDYLLCNINSMDHLKSIMAHNYMYNLRLMDYASMCNRSLASFKRDFGKCFGTSPGKWLMQKRMALANRLLRNSNLPVSDVAFQCGFEDASHFGRTYKKYYNETPNTFKMRVKAQV